MAKKLYGFDDAGRREYRQIRKTVLGGGRQTHIFKKWERGSTAGGSSGSVAGSVGMVFGDIPLADSWASMSGSPSLSWTVALGEAGPPALDDDSEWTDTTGVLLFDWERLASTKNEYIGTDGTLAPYDTDFDTMTPVVELAAGARRWAWRRGVNRSKTDIRASESEPILVAGYEQTIRQDGGLYRLFIITDVMDHRAFPGFVAGEKQFPINQTTAGDFAMIEGYVAGNDQSVGRDADGDAEWQDDGPCA